MTQTTEPKYKFVERSLEGTFIRVWSVAENKYVNCSLKDATNPQFDTWIRRKLDQLGVVLKESDCDRPNVWSIAERVKVCQFLLEEDVLVVLKDYLEKCVRSYLKQNKISVDHKNFYIDVMDSTKHPGTFRYEIHARSGAEVAFGFKQPTVEAAIKQAKKRIDDGRIAL